MEDIGTPENRDIIFNHFIKPRLELINEYKENNWDLDDLFTDDGDIVINDNEKYHDGYDENEWPIDLTKYENDVQENYKRED